MIILRRRGWLAAAVVALAALAAAGLYLVWRGDGAAPFVEYPMQQPEDMPIGIAAAADGTVWFSIGGADAIGRSASPWRLTAAPGTPTSPLGSCRA
jgi:virginiamycin B lyase